MPWLLGLGLLAAALFSVTFVLNRAMSLGGGHWVWSASLRYFDMTALLGGWLLLRRGPSYLGAVLRLFRQRLGFWLAAGGIGFGVFYACCCFAADHAPGWIIAATWQVTILATPFVLRAFGARVPRRGLVFLGLIFLGILILNAQRISSGVAASQILAGVLPVLVAAFAYPVGNQLLNRARHAGDEAAALLADPIAAVLLLTLGALPVFAALILVTLPPPPSLGQIGATAIIALVAGCFATTLFLYARNLSNDPFRIAAVDATQAGEVGFALLGEMLLLGTPPPDLLSWAGLAAVVAGLVGFTFQSRT
jgi:drug/metabolite transporter (DMT)-like permease